MAFFCRKKKLLHMDFFCDEALAAQHVAQQYHQTYKKQPEMRDKHHMYPNSCADNIKKWLREWSPFF